MTPPGLVRPTAGKSSMEPNRGALRRFSSTISYRCRAAPRRHRWTGAIRARRRAGNDANPERGYFSENRTGAATCGKAGLRCHQPEPHTGSAAPQSRLRSAPPAHVGTRRASRCPPGAADGGGRGGDGEGAGRGRGREGGRGALVAHTSPSPRAHRSAPRAAHETSARRPAVRPLSVSHPAAPRRVRPKRRLFLVPSPRRARRCPAAAAVSSIGPGRGGGGGGGRAKSRLYKPGAAPLHSFSSRHR